MEVNNQLLIGFESHYIKWNPFVAQLLDQEPKALQVTVPKGESTTVVLLHGHSTRKNYLWLIIISLDKLIIRKGSICNWWQLTQNKEFTVNWSVLNGLSISHFFFPRLKDHCGERDGKTVRARGSRWLQGNGAFIHIWVHSACHSTQKIHAHSSRSSVHTQANQILEYIKKLGTKSHSNWGVIGTL